MTCRTTGRALSRGAVALAFVVALVALGGCSSDPNSIAEQAKKGDQKGYIAGNGAIEQIPSAQRLKPITLEGTTLDGAHWSSTSARGKDVVVINLCTDSPSKRAASIELSEGDVENPLRVVRVGTAATRPPKRARKGAAKKTKKPAKKKARR